jgi:quercetin dioxygenase-like cupin family protein
MLKSHIVHLPAATGPSYAGPGDTYTFLLTGEQSGGAMFILEAKVPAAGGPPPHSHRFEDECFYLLEGSLTLRLAEKTIQVAAGDFVQVPKGIVHSFRNDGTSPAKMLAIFSPSGMEGYFKEALESATATSASTPIPQIVARMVAAAPQHGVEFVEG